MANFIDTIEQFHGVRERMQPVYINSKRHGQIEVSCANTILVARDLIVANHWNPNSVPPDKMELLRQSILDNGWCFPIVAIFDDETGKFIIIDGFHRDMMADPDWLDLDYIPTVVLRHDMAKRMAATVQFNKARGFHQVDLDADVVRSLIEQGLAEEEVAQRLGMELDAVHRYKQLTGIAELFKNSDYSQAWEMVENNADPVAPPSS